MREIARLVLIGSAIAAMLPAIMAVLALQRGDYDEAISWSGAVLAFMIGAAVFWYLGWSEGRAAFLAATRRDFRADRIDWFHGSGLAFDATAGRLLVSDRHHLDAFPVTWVKGFVYVQAASGRARSADDGPLGLLLALGSIGAAAASRSDPGLHITIDDRRRLVWHIHGIGESAARSWIDLIETARTREFSPQ